MISGKVAEIIDNRTVALNVGSDSGVEVGMRFLILKPDKELIDPETGDSLGSVKIPKIKVQVTTVSKKYCLAETYEYSEVNVGGVNTLGSLSNILAAPNYIRKFETFEIDEKHKKEIKKEKSVVQVGDLADQIMENGDTKGEVKA